MSNKCTSCNQVTCCCPNKVYKSYEVSTPCGCTQSNDCGCSNCIEEACVRLCNAYPKVGTVCGDDLRKYLKNVNDILTKICEDIESGLTPCDCELDLSGLDFSCLSTPSPVNAETVFQLIIDWISENIWEFDSEDFIVTPSSCSKAIQVNANVIAGDVFNLLINDQTFIDQIINQITYTTFPVDDASCRKNYLSDSFSVADGSGLSLNRECNPLTLYTYNIVLSTTDDTFTGFSAINGINYSIDTAKKFTVSAEVTDIINFFSTFGITAIINVAYPNVTMTLETHGNATNFAPSVDLELNSVPTVKTHDLSGVVDPDDTCCTINIDNSQNASQTFCDFVLGGAYLDGGSQTAQFLINYEGTDGSNVSVSNKVVKDGVKVDMNSEFVVRLTSDMGDPNYVASLQIPDYTVSDEYLLLGSIQCADFVPNSTQRYHCTFKVADNTFGSGHSAVPDTVNAFVTGTLAPVTYDRYTLNGLITIVQVGSFAEVRFSSMESFPITLGVAESIRIFSSGTLGYNKV